VTERSATKGPAAGATERVLRHALADRVFHWLTAASVLTLLGSAFLPILGFKFDWVMVHWVAGLVLIAAVLFHAVRALVWQNWRTVMIYGPDLREAAAIARAALRRGGAGPQKPGKYSFAQKLMHLSFTLAVLGAAATGALMLAHVETPWWRPNPYLLRDATWGYVYVVHDLAALTLITMVMVHVYFALRPEKLLFTRAMIRGWITRAEYDEHHDPRRWQVDR